ncbi:MAG: hypothetical protein PUB46_00290 [Lachnospiraceae bacterium]|uniref:hypothetical protein n=1 Tax=Roseburia hominis TaxID=301301 RepID=UPI001F26999F|nr:hypothetical protein [Roseburia hominis]MCI5711854.1 hypothetical protein [Lachnospiraceae bacterium]MDD6168502.1 hypothetical protein [Lachnospiraceae bacterium]MDY4839841.1 hypothetical protein [Lachnospiraceae bacterium]
MNTDRENKYEKMYDILLDYEQNIHQKNQKKIRIGLKCVVLIPLIFLILLFWTESSKIIFLVLWIVSVFVIATYLIAVEYQDYKLQEKLNELNDRGNVPVESLLGEGILGTEDIIKNAIQRMDNSLNIEERVPDKHEEYN